MDISDNNCVREILRDVIITRACLLTKKNVKVDGVEFFFYFVHTEIGVMTETSSTRNIRWVPIAIFFFIEKKNSSAMIRTRISNGQ